MATTQPKTPGVYISEPNSFPPSIVGVNTAVPAFVGYTESNRDKARPVLNTPVKITSMAEYAAIFGGPYLEKYYLVAKDTDPKPNRKIGTVSMDGVTSYDVVEIGLTNFNLYNSMRLFYANGGGACFIFVRGLRHRRQSHAEHPFQDLKDGLGVWPKSSGRPWSSSPMPSYSTSSPLTTTCRRHAPAA